MKTTRRITLEFLLLSALTFMLSLGHIIIANICAVPYLAYYFIVVYCLCVWISHRLCGMHRVHFGFVVTILVCIATFIVAECVLHKDEKGCRDWVVRIIDAMRQTNSNEEIANAHDAYFIYNNIDGLIAGEGQELSQFLPQEATDIWISHESGFGYEDWEVSCVVSETVFRRFVNERPDMRMSDSAVFGFDHTSYKMCNLFYQERLGISQEAISRIRTRDRFLECYVHDKNSHWHLTYCYDRISNILSCGFGR